MCIIVVDKRVLVDMSVDELVMNYRFYKRFDPEVFKIVRDVFYERFIPEPFDV
jgi:hypothetical protein